MHLNCMEHVAVIVEDLEKSTEGLKKVLGVEHIPTIQWTVKEDLDGNPKEP